MFLIHSVKFRANVRLPTLKAAAREGRSASGASRPARAEPEQAAERAGQEAERGEQAPPGADRLTGTDSRPLQRRRED